jgi:glutamyl-tRNA synthetase
MTVSVRVRIAPAPTGYLHVGTARAALYNWLFARKAGGRFILRIEDTDVVRSQHEMVEVILDSLHWLGLDWDEGPYFQSRRRELYTARARQLLAAGKAYRCFCRPDELEARRREPSGVQREWKYDRACLRLSKEEQEAREREGQRFAVRFLVPEGRTSFVDLIHGPLERENVEIEDFVLLKSAGTPTYQLACVADDADLAITHVIRGDDHVANTFKQLMLFQALDLTPPRFGHLPLILGADRAKLSKRKGAAAVTEFREAGFLPEAFVNFLALLGWAPPGGEQEFFTREELIGQFSLERVGKSGAVFDLRKLEWMNSHYLQTLDGESLFDAALPFLLEAGYFSEASATQEKPWIIRVLMLLRERAKTLHDFIDLGSYFFAPGDPEVDPALLRKYLGRPAVREGLGLLGDRLDDLADFGAAGIESALRDVAQQTGLKAADLIHPLRLAVTGREGGPSLFALLEVLGGKRVLRRLRGFCVRAP